MSHRSGKKPSVGTTPVDDAPLPPPANPTTPTKEPEASPEPDASGTKTPPQTPISAPTTPTPHFSHHDTPNAMPAFNGYDVDGWLRIITKCFTVACLAPTQWYQKAAEQCTGAAVHIVKRELGTSRTWDALCQAMRQAFRPPHFEVEARQRLRQLRLKRLEQLPSTLMLSTLATWLMMQD